MTIQFCIVKIEMMYSEIRQMKERIEYAIFRKKSNLENAECNNKKIEEYNLQLKQAIQLEQELREHKANLTLVKQAASEAAIAYQNKRVNGINEIITNAIQRIFPDSDFKAKLQCSFMRIDKARLLLEDKDGDTYVPTAAVGKLMQYLISLTAVAGITKGLGYNNLFIDEAFGVSNEDHMEDLGRILQQFVEDGMQIVLISQNPAVYNALERHEIHLELKIDETRNVKPIAFVSKEVDY